MKRVLVTGATSPLGVAVVDRLMRDDEIEHVLGVAIDPRMDATRTSGARFTYVTVDLTRPRSVHDLLFGIAKDLEIDTVVHLAQHRRARDDRARSHAITVESTRTLLTLLERHPTAGSFVLRSGAEVYRVDQATPTLVDEDHALELSADAPAWVRDRVESDVLASMALGTSRLRIVVLRLAECVAADNGSQLYDQLRSTVCMRPAGFDPMLDLLSLDDAAEAFRLAVQYDGRGIFNIAGFDTLPLSEAFARSGRRTVAVPGPLLHPIYGLRAMLRGTDFRYDANRWRFHFNGVLDGSHARAQIGYVPNHPLPWLSTESDRARRAVTAIGAI